MSAFDDADISFIVQSGLCVTTFRVVPSEYRIMFMPLTGTSTARPLVSYMPTMVLALSLATVVRSMPEGEYSPIFENNDHGVVDR